MPIPVPRVRYAPSPTGPQHIGGVRTAIYNYLFAKKHGGQFILRIEDTDKKRLVEGSEAYIKETLAWLGISPDEGPDQGGPAAPYRQSERKQLYRQYTEQLVKSGKAYYAFDSEEELSAMRVRLIEGRTTTLGYSALVRNTMQNSLTLPKEEVQRRLQQGHPYVIRLAVDPHATVRLHDKVRGWISVKGRTLDDKVLLKADGMPTYHLANVVDDHLMSITHVIRGEEWLPSSPIHILLYEGFGWQPPIFAHLPLLLKPDGKGKLSKRHGVQRDTPIFPIAWQDPHTGIHYDGFHERGYLPDALVNFLALQGWHPGGDTELFTREELIAHFSLERINKAGVKCDLSKAKWINQHYLQNMPDEWLAKEYLLPALAKKRIACDSKRAWAICRLLKQHITFPHQLDEESHYFFLAPQTFDSGFLHKRWQPTTSHHMQEVVGGLQQLIIWQPSAIKECIRKVSEGEKKSAGKLMPLLRLATTGLTKGPTLMEVWAILGKEETIARLKHALGTWSS